MIRTAITLLGALFLAHACCSTPPLVSSDQDGLTIYLVRHAEKLSGADDPGLTTAGTARAQQLARKLSRDPIGAVWSTDYQRTRATAAPIAARLELQVQLYDPSDLAAFASRLETDGATALVVGHSNTTPDLVALLGGKPGTPIDEASEYDRLYVLTHVGTDRVTTDIIRYGARYAPLGT